MGTVPIKILEPTAANIAADQNLALADLEVLHRLLLDGAFDNTPEQVGIEKEGSFMRPDGKPAHVAEAVLTDTDPAASVTGEVNTSNFEVNVPQELLAGFGLSRLESNLSNNLRMLTESASVHDARLGLFGIPPSLTFAEDLTLDRMTQNLRYAALNQGVMSANGGQIRLVIPGRRGSRRMGLNVVVFNIMPESASTSTQVHLSVTPDKFADTYNAAQLAAAVMLAVAPGSPGIDGLELWAETRVALFEQAIPGRTFFGQDWVTGVMEYFRSIVENFPPLILVPQGGLWLGALRFRSGTVWSWNRGCIFPAHELTVEMRSKSTGATVIDDMADATYAVGLTLHNRQLMQAGLAKQLPFAIPRQNFYAAARLGPDSKLLWPSRANPEKLLEMTGRQLAWYLLDDVQQALLEHGVDSGIVEEKLAVIAQRLDDNQTASSWLKGAVRRLGPEKAALLYMENSADGQGDPVGTWEPVK